MSVPRRRIDNVFVVLALIMVWLTPMSNQTVRATEFTQTFTDSIPFTTTNFTIPVELPQFDPTLGDLLEVTVEMEAEVDSTMRVENLSTSSVCNATLQWGATMTVQADVGDLVITPVDSQTILLDIYDGVTDFDGPSGETFASLTAAASGVFNFVAPGADLSDFIGTGVMSVPVDADALTTVTGCGLIAQLITTLASATVSVTYRYDASPAIDLEKATNGEDADDPTGPQIPVGDPVTWTYVVTNTGNVPLSSVIVTDDQGVVVDCPQDTLAVDESMNCTGNGTAEAGQYANVGTTSGEGPNGQVVMDEDPSHYFGVTPAIDIEKATNGNDADDPNGVDVPVVQPGDPVTWTYVVTNTGNAGIAEADVDVTDDVLGTITDIVDKGDGNAVLDPGESWTYQAIAPDGAADLEAPPPGTPIVSGCNAGLPGAERATYENIGMVEVPGASDSDPSHYCNPPGGGVDPMPAIDIEKATNGEDADDPTGPQIPVGDPVTWTYVVTNTGNVDLSDVGVVDDQGVTVTCPQDTLAVDESMTCTGNGTAEAGQYANTGTTEGTDPVGTVVTDEDPSHYFGFVPDAPAIDIEKATNGEDADDPTGPQIPVGDPVTWTYVVTNTGNVDLSDVGVVDDQGVTVTCPQDTLAVDESMTCTGNGTAELGQYANTGTTEGTAPDGTVVTDEDPSHYIGVELPDVPAIDIEKATNGHDADTPTGPWIAVGDPVTWTYVVTNTGSVPLSDVSVFDDHRVDITCPQDALDVGQSMTCTGPGIAQLGQYGNIGTTEGTAPDGTIVTDQDPSHYYGYLVKVWLDCSHGDVGCLGVAGQAPGQVTVLIDGVEYGCDGWWDPASNTSRFHCMVNSTLLNDTVTVEIYVDGVLMWSGTGIPAQCDLLPGDPNTGNADGENTTEAVREEQPKAVTDRDTQAKKADG